MANVNLKKDFVNGEKLYDYHLNNNFSAIEAALAAMNKIVWQDDEENGAGVSAYKGDTDAIEDRELIDGQLLYNTETGETYIDTYVDDELKRINTGSGNVVAIQETEPTNDAVKLWIETDTLDGLGTEIVNEYSESTGLGYSADYINKELYYKDGDTVRFDLVVVSGFITSSTTKLMFTLPLPKSIQNIASASLNNTAELLSRVPTGGYLDNNSSGINYNTGNYTTDVLLRKESNTLLITVTKNASYDNVTNNMPVSVTLYNTVITFDEESEEA